MAKTKKIELGNRIKDIVTGFTGIAVSKVEYLNGCIQVCVKPQVNPKDNKMPEGQYIDIEQLKFVSKGVNTKKKPTGGVMNDMPSVNYNG